MAVALQYVFSFRDSPRQGLEVDHDYSGTSGKTMHIVCTESTLNSMVKSLSGVAVKLPRVGRIFIILSRKETIKDKLSSERNHSLRQCGV